MGTAVNLYTRICPQGKGAKGLYYGGTESKYAILGGGGEVIHDKMEYSLNPRQSSNSAAAQGQTFTTSNLITGSGTHGNGVSISGISITPSTIEIDANPSSSSTREIRRTVSQVHNAYGIGYTGASCELVFSQGRDYVSSMTLTLGTPSVIAARGGSVNSCSYTLTVNWASGKQQTYSSIIPNGASINWTGVTAGSKGTSISNQTTAGTLRCTVSFDGKTASDNATVYQTGNYVTSIDLTGFAIAYSKSVSAAGGTVSPTVTNGTVRYYYSSESNGTATPSSTYGSLTSAIIYSGSAANGFSAPNATTGAMTASNRGTTTGSSRNSGIVTATRTVTWTPSGSYNSSGVKSDSMSDSDYATQVANSVISSSRVYDAPTFSLESSYTFGEEGGSYTISPSNGRQTYTDTYTSGSHSTGSTTLSGTYSYTTQTAATGFSRSNNIVTATKNTVTTARGGFVVRVTLTANGKSSYKDITFSQEAASLNVEGWSISLTYSDIPAGGGSVSPNLSYTFTYVSGGTTHRVTTGAVVSYDYNNGVVSASNLGTTEKSRTLIRTIKVTLSYVLNGQTYTGSTTANVYQEANTFSYTDYRVRASTLSNQSNTITLTEVGGTWHYIDEIPVTAIGAVPTYGSEFKYMWIEGYATYTSESKEWQRLEVNHSIGVITFINSNSQVSIPVTSHNRQISYRIEWEGGSTGTHYPTSPVTARFTLTASGITSVTISISLYYIKTVLDMDEIEWRGGELTSVVASNAPRITFYSTGSGIMPTGGIYGSPTGILFTQKFQVAENDSGSDRDFTIRNVLSLTDYPIMSRNGGNTIEETVSITQVGVTLYRVNFEGLEDVIKNASSVQANNFTEAGFRYGAKFVDEDGETSEVIFEYCLVKRNTSPSVENELIVSGTGLSDTLIMTAPNARLQNFIFQATGFNNWDNNPVQVQAYVNNLILKDANGTIYGRTDDAGSVYYNSGDEPDALKEIDLSTSNNTQMFSATDNPTMYISGQISVVFV